MSDSGEERRPGAGIRWRAVRAAAAAPATAVIRHPLAAAGAAAVVGILVADFAGRGHAWLWIAAGGSALAGVVLGIGRPAFLLAFVLAAFGLLHDLRLASVPDGLPGGGGLRRLEGIVFGVPVPATATGLPGRCVVEVLDRAPAPAAPRGSREVRTWRMEVRLPDDADGMLRDGDRVRLRGWLAAPSPPRNPGGFDAAAHLLRNGLAGRLTLRTTDEIEIVSRRSRPTLAERAASARAWLRGALTKGLDDSPEVGAVIASMVLGAQDDTPEEVEEQFRRSGTLHLFAISGLHVGIFSYLLWSVAKLARLRRTWAIALIIPLVFAYAFVTGWRPSAARAAVMISLLLAGLLAGRGVRPANTLGAAALVVLGFDSHQLFLPGFQLSFVVLGSILLLARPIGEPLLRRAAPDPFLPPSLLTDRQKALHRGMKAVAALLAVSVAAWIGSAPLTWLHFGMVAPIGIVANLLLMPAAYVVLSVALVSLGCAGLGLALPTVLANNTNWLIARSILGTAAFFAAVPGGNFHLAEPGVLLAPRPAQLRITVLDIPSGGACHVIEGPRGRPVWMVDAGDEISATGTVRRFLARRGIDRLDGLVLTHWDGSHSGGAAELIAAIRPRRIILPPGRSSSPSMAATLRAIEMAGLTGIAAAAEPGALLFNAENVGRLEIVHAPSRDEARGAGDDQCLVLRLTRAEGASLLFAGDAGFRTEQALLESGNAGPPPGLGADILVVGRHRTDPGFTPAFLEAVAPRAVIASHASFPAAERFPARAEDALREQGVLLFRQDECGAVTITMHRDGRIELESALPVVGKPRIPAARMHRLDPAAITKE